MVVGPTPALIHPQGQSAQQVRHTADFVEHGMCISGCYVCGLMDGLGGGYLMLETHRVFAGDDTSVLAQQQSMSLVLVHLAMVNCSSTAAALALAVAVTFRLQCQLQDPWSYHHMHQRRVGPSSGRMRQEPIGTVRGQT